jgi:hypothetical protein
MFFCSYGCTAGLRKAGVVRRGGGPAPPLVRVGYSRPSARRDTLLDDPHVAADTPACMILWAQRIVDTPLEQMPQISWSSAVLAATYKGCVRQ